MNATDVPVRQRLIMLQDAYSEMRATDAYIYRWMLEADEFSMFDSYFDIETSVAKKSPDLFLQFNSPFSSKSTYDKALYRELSQNLEDYLSSDEKGKVEVNWRPELKRDTNTFNNFLFCGALERFRHGIPDLEDRIIVYLTPKTLSSDSAFQDWILSQLESSYLENIRFMLVDYIDAPRFEMVRSKAPEKVHSRRANLDMTGAMKEINAASGQPEDPDVLFRAAFMDMSKAISKKNEDETLKFADRAISICVQEGWTHLHVGVLVALGSAWIGYGKNEYAIREYDKAEKLAQSANNQGDSIAAGLLTTVLFAKAGVYIQQKAFDQAVKNYEAVPPLTENDPNQNMEGWRMSGFCYEQLDEPKLALKAYEHALIAAEQMKISQEDARKSTIPFIGRSILKLSDKASFKKKLDQLLGEGWQRIKIKIK